MSNTITVVKDTKTVTVRAVGIQPTSIGGDMLAATYDPTNKSVSAFDMGNMDEGASTKILTDTERTNIATNNAKVGITPTQASDISNNNAKTGVTNEEANPDLVSQAEAEAGTSTTERTWTAERVKQSVESNSSGSATPYFIHFSGYIQMVSDLNWYSRALGPQNIFWHTSTFATSIGTTPTAFDSRIVSVTFPFNCKISNAVIRLNRTNAANRILNIKGYAFTSVTGSATPSNVREIFDLSFNSVTGPAVLIQDTDFTIDDAQTINKNDSFVFVVNQDNTFSAIAANWDMIFEFEKV